MIRDPFPSPRSPTAAIPPWMQQFNPVRIDHSQQSGSRQKAIGPRPMRSEQAKQARAFGQPWKQRAVITDQPAVEGSFPNAFQSKQDPDRDRFAGPQVSLRVLR